LGSHDRPPRGCTYRELKPLAEPLAEHRVCLFAHYDPQQIIDEYVVYYLRCLAAAGVRTVFVSTADSLPAAEVRKIDSSCAAILQRDNIGLDFGSWRTALFAYPALWQCDSLFFANDSVYGPMHDVGAMLSRMAATGCDFFGVTESLEFRSHYQSYFLGFHRACLRSRAFLAYCRGIQLLPSKVQIIQKYELGLKSALARRGLRGAAVVPAGAAQRKTDNPTLHLWRQILAAQAPFLKIQLLRENPHQQEIADWPQVVRSYGYDPGLIERHLRRVGRVAG
jgi:lipopolysaccharide biosynthesis protein